MLRGSVDVQSEVGKGTEVTIRLPLSRLPGTTTPVSTPSTVTTDGSASDSIDVLHAEYSDATVGLHGFDVQGNDSACNLSGQVLRRCIEDWFRLRSTSSSSDDASIDLLIVDEKNIPHVLKHDHNLPTIVLCSNTTRSQTESQHHASRQATPTVMDFVSKPVGPHKLAKALRICLDKAKSIRTGLAPTTTLPDDESPMESSEADTIVPELETLTLETEVGSQPLQVQTNGVLTASESENALMAIDSSSSEPNSGEAKATDGQDFPFPIQDGVTGAGLDATAGSNEKSPRRAHHPLDRPKDGLTRRDSRRPPLVSRMTEPLIKIPFRSLSAFDVYGETYAVRPPPESIAAARKDLLPVQAVSSLTTSNVALYNGEIPNSTTPPILPPDRENRPPRLLLVDDNKINLRLLETYMRKRKYKYVDSAENGQLAVQAAELQQHGYDIIFMGGSVSSSSNCLS